MANLDDVYDVDHRTQAFENHEHGYLVCLAGPGTGKTYSLLARASALAQRDCDPETLCYLTFIREVSNAFVDDYKDTFGAAAFEERAPRISTLHSFACRILRNQGFRIAYDGHLYFANAAERDDGGDTFLGDLLPFVSAPGCRTVPQLRNQLDFIKNAWRDSVDLATLPESALRILGAALDLLRAFRLVDWDQTIPLAHDLLRALDPLPTWIGRIRHYFVDEFQDFNRAEQGLITSLGSHAQSVVIVGDDDQSLYGGRGGAPDGIRVLYSSHEHDRVSLVKCYRCKGDIVTSANTFQATMSAAPRPMIPACAGGEVVCFRFKSSKAEVSFLAEWLAARIAEIPDEPRPKDGIVCLFRTKRVLNCYFDFLSPSVPCARRGTIVPPNRLWLERILQLVLEPRKRFLERLLLNQYTGIKPRHRAPIVQRILDRDIAPSVACESLLADGAFTGQALEAARSFSSACSAIAARDLPQVSTIIEAALGIPQATGLQQLELLMTSDEAARAETIDPICDVLLPDTAATPEDLCAILFLTIHSSKGLTKKNVCLPGLEEAWLPGPASPSDLPERRRLFYVAITRATDQVLLTFPHNRGRNDTLNFDMPGRGIASSFFAEAGLVASYHP